ncbi:MAG: 1,4-alpha-glucan branching protein GlgB [Verrucomicrobiota bacterium]|jgi:1,4-alpha-glucan branching enzyme
MILSKAEFASLTEVRNSSPHSLLGLHSLGLGEGVVARAIAPGAATVEFHPLGKSRQRPVKLTRLGQSDVFEGADTTSKKVFPYELVVTDGQGKVHRRRDPYSFLPTIGEADLFLFGKGDERKIYDKLGAQLRVVDGVAGVSFAVWAPSAQRVSVVGDFNFWDGRTHMMRLLGASGVWEIFVPGLAAGARYKFEVRDCHSAIRLKTDPHGFLFETPPDNAAIVCENKNFKWTDAAWLKQRRATDALKAPMSVYEIHLGSWKKKSATESLGYRELAAPLIAYVRELGFTHVEFLPLAEHAFYPSWGYQVTGFFAPTSRYGSPEDFQYLVNELHQAGIGIILDWVPAHFPRDDWALARFDGTALYEHEDPRKGAHQDWGTLIFNYERHEVLNFLIANALFWCERYHIDGLRVDAVASMLYLDYSRKAGEWIPNKFGGRENLDAVEFFKKFNHLVHTEHPGVVTIAEESTAWPLVTRPPYIGGLGFSIKWNMGWMHDTLGYFKREPVHRKYHQNDLTFAMLYHHNENFALPLSHDEVVHGKGSLLARMPGDDWQRFANLRVLLGYQWFFPGKKLLFMGCEFGQSGEWNSNSQLDWNLLLAGPFHKGAQKFLAAANKLYAAHPEFWRGDFDPRGFQWIDCDDSTNSVMSFIRRDPDTGAASVVVLNLTPVMRNRYRVGFPTAGAWTEALNSDAKNFGGSGQGNRDAVVTAQPTAWQNQPASAELTLPPLSLTVFVAA